MIEQYILSTTNTLDTILNKTPEIRRHEIGNIHPLADLKTDAALPDTLLDDRAADPSASMAEH